MNGIRLLAVALIVIPAAGTGAGPEPHLDGTFIQLWQAHKSWRPEEWDRLFSYFHRMHLSRLVIQWSTYNESQFYSSPPASADGSVIGALMDRADVAGMKVLVGLSYDSNYWRTIENDPVLVRVFLRRAQLRAEKTARELKPAVLRHRSFEGWYISEEIDDINWNEAERRDLIVEYLKNLSSTLSKLSPGKNISLSGFSNAFLSPEALAVFWGRILVSTQVDQLLFQDGVGTRKIPLSELRGYLGPLHAVAKQNHRDLCIAVETFQQENAEGSGAPFHALPAPLDRLLRQIEIDARFADCGLVGFGIPEYLSPLGGSTASVLYEEYCRSLGY